MNKLAAEIKFGELRGFGKLGLEWSTSPSSSLDILSGVLSLVIGLITVVGGLYFVYTFLSASLSLIGSQGDKEHFANARKKILNAVVGFIVLICGIFLVKLLGSLFGLDILNLPKIFGQISGMQP